MTPSMIRTMIMALGTATLIAAVAGPARADDDWHHDRGPEFREREWHEHEWHEWCLSHPVAYAYPGYYCPVAAPPPVVVAPPAPVIASPPPAVIYAPPPPPPALEIEVPVHIR